MKYTLVKRGNPRYPERGQKVYASAQFESILSFDELIDFILLHGSVYGRGDYKAVVSALAEAMAEKMADGYKIDLGEMGKFYPTLDCVGAETTQDFDPEKHIRAVRVNWNPGDDFKDLKSRATFREYLTRRQEKEAIKLDMYRMQNSGE